jgi:hypothetical protein
MSSFMPETIAPRGATQPERDRAEDGVVPILDDIRGAVADASYRVTGHAADQMVAADIDEIWVLEATMAGEVIDDFPTAFPSPSCLVVGETPAGQTIHALWTYDELARYAVLLTVYRPRRRPSAPEAER